MAELTRRAVLKVAVVALSAPLLRRRQRTGCGRTPYGSNYGG